MRWRFGSFSLRHIISTLTANRVVSWPDRNGTIALQEDTRVKALTQPIYYVSPTGSNANNGLTAGTPFLTIQKAIDTLTTIDCNGFDPRIILAAGNYDQPVGGLQLKNVVGVGQRIFIEGSAAGRTSYKIRGTDPSNPNFDGRGVVCFSNTLYRLVGVELGWVGNVANTFHKTLEVITPIELEDCCIRGNTAEVDGLSAYGSTTIRIRNTVQIEGSFRFVFDVNNAFLYIENVVFTGTATFTEFFMGTGGIILGYAPSSTGTFTGRQYNLTKGHLQTYGSGSIPGSIAGVYN